MPLTIKRTNTTSIAANSVLFNGSDQYLNTPSDSNFTFGTGSFTMEFWCNYTLSSAQNLFARRFLSQGANSLTRFQIWIADTSYTVNSVNTVAGGILLAHNDPSVQLVGSVNAYNDGNWHHVAFTRGGGTLYCFVDGVLKQSVSNSTNFSAIDPMYIAGRSDGGRFAGYISNLRLVKGTALYTASFTAPTSPLTAIANTSLLTCNAPTIVDSSTNNFTITNNGAATVSSVSPFVAPINNFQFARRTSTVSGKSVLFNGTNQYLSVARILDNSTDVTIEAWVRATSTPASNGGYVVSQYVASAADRTIFAVGTDLKIFIQIGSTFVGSTGAITLNTWYHLAWVRSGSGANNFSIYINGVRDGQMTYTGTFQNTPTTIGGTNNLASTYFPGYISNLRILKGTALYTTNFTPPTAPLTAISGTSLLVCNAATIFDSSTNNFTITNNNGATVSSVSPFVVPSGGMSLKKVYADPLFGTQRAIFGYGRTGTVTAITNLVSNTGVVATDTTGVGTERSGLSAAGYGTDKAIFGYGIASVAVSMTNLVSNTGVVATDTTGVGTSRKYLTAAGYGSDKAIFGYGNTSVNVSITNLVSNTGVVASNTTGVGTARQGLAAAGYGIDKAIFGYGSGGLGRTSITNLVSNTGVVATDTTGVGTVRTYIAAAGYGSDKAIFGYGQNNSSADVSITNLVSNTGVVSTDTTGVGTARNVLAAAGYGSDKAIFGYGLTSVNVSMTNLVSNTGVVATDTTGVGTARYGLAAAGYSLS